jgi:predicted enzyme related to lactoylglutathione lyase
VRARAFYALVLGWGFVPGRAPGGWHVLNADGTDLRPTTGLGAGTAGPTVVPMFTVADIATAVRAVRAAGGSVTEPVRQPYGTSAECTDDQGARFRLIEY